MLDTDEDTIVGKLHKLWSWADQHTTDGNAVGVTEKWIDRYVSVTGFAHSLVNVGWLSVKEDSVCIPNFDIHNGKPAKQRALTGQRVKRKRNAVTVTKALPEKRREEKSKDLKTTTPNKLISDAFNEAFKGTTIPKCSRITDRRREQLKARMEEPVFRNHYAEIFAKAAASEFMTTPVDGKWKGVTFDWLIQNDSNYTKVFEGNYDNDGRSTAGSAKKQVSFGGETNVSGRTFEEGQDLEL